MEHTQDLGITNTGIEVTHHAPLASTEIANLWRSHSYYSMLYRTMQHFNARVNDSDVHQLLEQALDMVGTRTWMAVDMLVRENHPEPVGFREEDVDLNAPRLYTDEFYLYFLLNMVRYGMGLNVLALGTSVRPDVREYFSKAVERNIGYYNRINDILLAKGLFIRPPAVTTINQVDFVKKQDFMAGFLRERRPLLVDEVKQIYVGIVTNRLGGVLLTGFAQVAKSDQVRGYMERGIKIADKHVSVFSSKLQEHELSAPMQWAINVTDSTLSPYTDKLMMNFVITLNLIGITNYSNSLTQSPRHDLEADYMRLMAEATNYSEDGVNIAIENGWYEEPPRIIDRQELSNDMKH